MKIATEIVLKVLSLPKVGRKTAFKLLARLSYPVTSNQDLIDFITENKVLIKGELAPADMKAAFDRAEVIIESSEKGHIRLVSFYDQLYPELLRDTNDPPLLLSIKGNVSRVNKLPAVAIIGTREPSDLGFRVGMRLGDFFGRAGCNVVSGLATGCDTAGHKGCLAANGVTTAVMAHGLDTIYPKENSALAAEILDKGGLLVSEYLIGQRPQANYFVERDRIQAALSKAVIVVETDIKGGSMHTIKFAKTYGRQVAAFNHPPQHLSHPKTQGNQFLIKNGTALPLTDSESLEQLKQYITGSKPVESSYSEASQKSENKNESPGGTQLHLF